MVVRERDRESRNMAEKKRVVGERRKEKQNEKQGHAGCFNELGLLDEMVRLVT